jgi:hypothetical protein
MEANDVRYSKNSLQKFIVILSIVAGIKILFFSFALPFFPLDEELHFDAVHKFATGYKIQRELPGFDTASAELIELYHSPEFLRAPLPGKPFLPLPWWCTPSQEHLPPELAFRVNTWQQLRNVEIDAPPMYYIIAAEWYKLGRLLGYDGIFILYWVRSLNAIACIALIILAWLFVRECYPDNEFLQISVPIFLLVFPQDSLLFIIPNAIFAPFMALTLLLLVKLLKNPSRGIAIYIAAGFVAACTALLGFGNFVVVIPLFWIVWANFKNSQQPNRQALLGKISVMLAVAGAPVALWVIHNKLVLGNLSGSKTKQQYLDWSIQPVSQMLHHPLFSMHGFSYFISTLCHNFWRGEMNWHFAPRTAWIDHFYLWSSILFCGIFAVAVLRSKTDENGVRRFTDVISIAVVSASVLFLMAISIPFDFGRCFYPSRALPYFVSGRIIIGVLLPFLIMYLRGLQITVERISKKINPLHVSLGLAGVIFVTETVSFAPIMASHFTLISIILGRSCGQM